MIIEDEKKMIDYLKKNPGRIGVIGEKLLNQESEKKSNGEKSKIFELLEKQGKCRLYTGSTDAARNNKYLMLEHLKVNPGRIGVIGDKLLEKELEKSENGEKSEIFELLEKQGKCRLYKDSSDTTRNNEYLMLEHLKINPGEVGVIGEELLKQEIEKRKNGEKSKIFDLLEEQKKCNIYINSLDYIRNNEYLMLENLKINPGKIGVIGDSLIKQELAKRENGQKSEMLDLFDEQDECIVYNNSSDFIRNNEYFIFKRLQRHPGRIGTIGENLLKQELEKREKGQQSKILDLLDKQGKCIIDSGSNENAKNSEYLMLKNLEAHPGRIGVIGDDLLKKELEKRKRGEKSNILDLVEKQGKCALYTDSSQYIRNNEYLVLENLKANSGRIGVIGEELLNQEIEKRKNGEKSQIFDLLEQQKQCIIFDTSPDYIKNNEYLVKKYLEFESEVKLDRIGQELLQKELDKGFYLDSQNNIKTHNSEIIKKILKLRDNGKLKIASLPEVFSNNVDFMRYLVEEDINNLGYLNEKVFKEIWKDENIRKEAEENFLLKPDNSEFVKNNEELIQISLKKDMLTLNYVGEKHFEEYLDKYENKFFIRLDAIEHVKSNPKAIQYTIKNKPALFRNINQVIIINEFNKVITGEESELFEQVIKSIGIKNKSDFFDTLKRIYDKNNSVFENFNINLMKDYYMPIRSSFNILCDDRNIQDRITDISKRNKKDMAILGKILDSVSLYNDNISKKDLFGDIIAGMASGEYKELIENIRSTELKEDDIEKLGWLFCNKNYFSIKTYEDVQNLDNIINQICERIMNNPEEDFSEYPLINKMSPLTRMEHAVMMKSGYMMGINEAVKLQEMFLPLFDGIDESSLTDEELAIFTELQNFKYIRTLEDDDALEFCREFYNIVSQEQELKTYKAESYQTDILCNLATRLYNEKCYKPLEKHEINTVTYRGTDIPVYNAGTEFSMLIHVVGAYNSDSRNVESYKKSWNRPETQKHGFSAGYIGNGMLGTARIESVIYGFNQIENGGLIAAAPWDIASVTTRNGYIPVQSIDTLNKLSKGNRVKVCNPEKQLLNTRHTHNEIILERNMIQKDGSLKKRQPDYVVYIVDNYDELEVELDPHWKETKKAALEFGIPIVIVEREKCAQKEAKEIEQMLCECKKENDMQMAVDTLNKLQTNIAGCREYNVDIQNRYFPDSKTHELLDRIKDILHKDLSEKNYEKFKQDYEIAIKFEEEEKQKWKITGRNNRTDFKGYDHELFKKELQEILESNKKEVQVMEEKLDVERILDKDDEDIQKLQYSSKISECIKNNEQMTTKEVIDIMNAHNIEDEIKDIKSTGLYDERKAHSIHHIQDVTIFGAILGHKLGLSEHEMPLLIEACKYHDSGRTDDNNYEHADKSQQIAKERLEGKYSADDIGIIRAAIMYHEFYDKDKDESDIFFGKICKKYEVKPENIERARYIADILKDADALDRCRFVNRAELNPNFLRLEESRSLVEVAKKINEGYAKQICEQKGYLDDDEIKQEIQQFGYLSTERRIRKTGILHNNTEKRNIRNKAISVKAIGKRTFPASKREDRDLMLNILEREQTIERQEELEIEPKGVIK